MHAVKDLLTWYCWMEISKTTAANTQPSFKIQKIADWMHCLDKTALLEYTQPRQGNN
jgi:hypothetical protein